MRKIIGISAMVVASLLAACGGGGGSPGDTKLPYSIQLRTEKAQLPLNISNLPAGIGAYAPYTTTLYVTGKEGDSQVLGGDDIFACNLAAGLGVGSLVYLDGKPEHQDADGNAKLYRSITLGANSGANSFHFHSGDKAGTARITCSITNPNDQQISTASVDIVVGAATGFSASVIANAKAPGFLGSRGNLSLLRNNVGIQAFVMDDANQPIPDPSAPNLQISIRQSSASAGSRLLAGVQTGSVVQVRTIGGVGLVSLSSGADAGGILLEFVTDSYDNDVSNGIQDPVASLYAVGVYHAIASTPLEITTTDVASASEGVPFVYLLEASGGVPPYSWSAVGGLPSGLTLSSSGIIQGTPSVPGTFQVVIQVTDGAGAVATRNVTLTVAAAPPPPEPPEPPAPPVTPLTIVGCAGAGDCSLPGATSGAAYLYSLSATGGDTTEPVTWTYTPAVPAPGLILGTAGNDGVISGTITPANLADCTVRFLVTATRGTASVSQPASIIVTGGVCPAA